MNWQGSPGAVLVCLAILGCHGGVETDILERELRLQEDRIYQLKDRVEQYQEMLAACRAENQPPERDSGGQVDEGPSGRSRPSRKAESRDDRPNADSIRPPLIEPGIPTTPESIDTPEATEEPAVNLHPSWDDTRRGNQLGGITLNPHLTGGLNEDGQSGDEGILAVVEPIGNDGQVMKTQGQVSLMVMDPAKTGPEARIARWDFSEVQASDRWQSSELGQGLFFELPWPDEPPTRGQLILWARLRTSDGHKFLANLPIDVDLGDRTARQWQGTPDFAARHHLDEARMATLPKSRRWTGQTDRRPLHSVLKSQPAAPGTKPGRSTPHKKRTVLPAPPASVDRPEWQPYR